MNIFSKALKLDQIGFVLNFVESLHTLYDMQGKVGELAARLVGLGSGNQLTNQTRMRRGVRYNRARKRFCKQADTAIGYLKQCDGPLHPLFGEETSNRINSVVEKLLELQQWTQSSAQVLLDNYRRVQQRLEEVLAFARLLNLRLPSAGYLPTPRARDKKWTCDAVRKDAEAYVKRHGWPGRNRLAVALGAPESTVSKAVKRSSYLQARKAEAKASRRGREVLVTPKGLDELTAPDFSGSLLISITRGSAKTASSSGGSGAIA